MYIPGAAVLNLGASMMRLDNLGLVGAQPRPWIRLRSERTTKTHRSSPSLRKAAVHQTSKNRRVAIVRCVQEASIPGSCASVSPSVHCGVGYRAHISRQSPLRPVLQRTDSAEAHQTNTHNETTRSPAMFPLRDVKHEPYACASRFQCSIHQCGSFWRYQASACWLS